MNTNGRRNWPAAAQRLIVLERMHSGVSVSDLCRREGSSPDLYYL
jgi:transposase-like protein